MAYGETAAERLAAVRAAIQRALTSQEYGVGERRQKNADLRALRELERELMHEVAAETGSGSITLGSRQDPA